MLGLTLAMSVYGQVQQQGDVITQKIGASHMFIFAPDRKPRIGTIKVGSTITIKYGIRQTGTKARFIAMDSTKAGGRVKPILQPGVGDTEGFMVEDKRVPMLHVHIDPNLMKKVAAKVNRVEAGRKLMSREANLNVELTNRGGRPAIEKVTVY